MKGNAILQVTRALYDRLLAALMASGVPGTVFVGPLDDPGASGAALILFLYRIEPSVALRNCEHRVTSPTPPPPAIVYQNALPLNLYFLVTVGTKPGPTEETLLGALGYVIQSLQADPDLTGYKIDHETVHLSLEPLSTEEISRIWALFPTANYRTSVAYLATPVWVDPPTAPLAIPPVTQDQLRAGSKVPDLNTN